MVRVCQPAIRPFFDRSVERSQVDARLYLNSALGLGFDSELHKEQAHFYIRLIVTMFTLPCVVYVNSSLLSIPISYKQTTNSFFFKYRFAPPNGARQEAT